MSRRLLILAAVSALLSAGLAPPAEAQPGAQEYAALWREASSALVSFATVSTAAPSGRAGWARLAPGWRRERDRFEAAVVRLIKTVPPAGLTALHWKLLPLHEELVAALSTIADGAEHGDGEAVALGWTWARQALAMIDRVTSDARAKGE
jgi:hypothetical protein